MDVSLIYPFIIIFFVIVIALLADKIFGIPGVAMIGIVALNVTHMVLDQPTVA